MRVLFALREPYLPDTIGGGVLSIHDMTRQFIDLGHQCEIMASVSPGARLLLYRLRRRLSRRRWTGLADDANGYPTLRAWDWLLPRLLRERLAEFRPQVVITQGVQPESLAHEAIACNVPAITRMNTAEGVEALHRAQTRDAGIAQMLRSPLFRMVSTSTFIADRVRERLGLESQVVFPLIRCAPCPPASRRPEFITLINPSRIKGLDVALGVAERLPHRQFLFVESWPLDGAALADLSARLRTLRNVKFQRRSMQMQDVYARSALLLVPSQCADAFPRVVVEAAINGIPVVGSRTGGIPEAMADGGLLLAPSAPADEWADAVERIMADRRLYQDLSARAIRNAGRRELDPRSVGSRLIEIAKAHAFSSRAGI